MALAKKINAWLTPARRQALYVIVTTLATVVAATTPIQSTQVAIWLQLVIAVGVVGSQILGSIVTKSVPWKAVYRVLGILVAAITAAGWLSGAHADLVMRTLEQFGAIVPMIAILLRTDTSTTDGTLPSEGGIIKGSVVGPVVDIPVASPSTLVKDNVATFNPGDGTPTTSTPI